VSSLSTVNTKFAWTANGAGGQYNVSYDVWFTNDWYGVTVPGVPGTWDVWTDGVCISCATSSPVYSLTFDLNGFIKDATNTQSGTISNNRCLHDVFGGFEIWSGG
jgi:hypothetical protein